MKTDGKKMQRNYFSQDKRCNDKYTFFDDFDENQAADGDGCECVLPATACN